MCWLLQLLWGSGASVFPALTRSLPSMSLSLGPGIYVLLGEADPFLTHSACAVG